MDESPPPCSPAADRNKAPILAALQPRLPAAGRALEIAAGTGQHAAHLAAALPGWRWQPTDADATMLPVIAAHCAGLPNVAPPRTLDVAKLPWPDDLGGPVGLTPFDLVYCANLLHIAPWACCTGLMRGAAAVLKPDGRLVTYGPYRIDGEAFADSNQRFDDDLRAGDPRWGIRRLADVVAEAEAAGLALAERIAMPANNQLLVFRPRVMAG